LSFFDLRKEIQNPPKSSSLKQPQKDQFVHTREIDSGNNSKREKTPFLGKDDQKNFYAQRGKRFPWKNFFFLISQNRNKKE